jgi:hypothetical protein
VRTDSGNLHIGRELKSQRLSMGTLECEVPQIGKPLIRKPVTRGFLIQRGLG